jgi:hypothetical protein
MKLVTKHEASELYCPFDIAEKCVREKCMAFEEIHKKITRENHSNGMQMIQ